MPKTTLNRPMPVTLLPSVIYKTINGLELHMDVLHPTPSSLNPWPAAITIVGFGAYLSSNFGAGMATNCCPLIASHGFVAASIQVRTSFEAQFPAQIEDVKAAISFLRSNAASYNIDSNKIGIWGHSAGGHLAALAGLMQGATETTSSKVQAVVVGSSPADFLAFGGYFQDDSFPLVQLFGGKLTNNRALAHLASPINHVSKAAPPFLIAHGTNDETIPFSHAEVLRDRLKDAGTEVEFIKLEHCYHNWSKTLEGEGNEADLNLLALEFFKKHLG